MPRRVFSGVFALAMGSFGVGAGCGGGTSGVPGGAPAPATPRVSPATATVTRDESSAAALAPIALPAPPKVAGPLSIRVVYPQVNQQLTARDTNFIFGSLGTGDAQLTINDIPVKVEPNGAFLAWIPVPPPAPVATRTGTSSAPPLGVYRIVATNGADTARSVFTVRLVLPRVELSNSGKLELDGGSVSPKVPLQLPANEPVRVSVRAPANATVYVRDSAGTIHPLRNAAAIGAIRGIMGLDSTAWSADVSARTLASAKARLVVSRGTDSIGASLSVVRVLDDEVPQLGALRATPGIGGDTDAVTIVRPTPSGTYRWMLFPGTVLPITGRVGNAVRVRLDKELDAWVEDADIAPLPSGAAAPRRVFASIRSARTTDWVDVIIPTIDRPPFLVSEDGRQLIVTLYATTPAAENVAMPLADALVKSVRYEQPFTDRGRVIVELNDDPYGYMVFWNGTSLVLRVRRPPVVDPGRPLLGLTIAVDPGHPPIGSTGPTGFYEGDATFEISQRLKAMLEERGATVFMTRTSLDPVPLADRAPMARQANVHAFVSIHLNALPDGANPYLASRGTGTYHYFPHSYALAASVQAGLVRHMGLRNEGVYYQNLAVARTPWFPAVLCEGAYIMRPDHEAALRTPEFQAAYAVGVVEGLEEYFRSRRR